MWTLYELARHPDLQEELRAEISAARVASKGDMVQMLKMVPLLKGALKETLRYTNSSDNICSTIGAFIFQGLFFIKSLVQSGRRNTQK